MRVRGLDFPGYCSRGVRGESPRFRLKGEGPRDMRGEGPTFRHAR